MKKPFYSSRIICMALLILLLSLFIVTNRAYTAYRVKRPIAEGTYGYILQSYLFDNVTLNPELW